MSGHVPGHVLRYLFVILSSFDLRFVGVTMKLEHTKRAESLIRGCSVAQQVHLLSQLRVLELMGTRSLPTPGLCQPRSLPEHWGFIATLLEWGCARQQPHPYGRCVSSTITTSLLRKGDSSVVCILTTLLF